MPRLALTKPGFNPHLPFLIGLFVRVGLMVRRYAVKILLKKAGADRAAVLAGRAFWL